MPTYKKVEDIARDISALKIQGARNIAKKALDGLIISAQNSNAKTKDALYSDLFRAAKILEATRPTEPMMRNSLEQTLKYVLAWVNTHPTKDVKLLKSALKKHKNEMQISMEESIDDISKYGSREISDGADILIHCHSTTVMGILKKAYDDGKNIHVTCLETRPLYQGRLSARELADYGIRTTLVVDSAMGSVISDIDLVLVGADAMTAEGDLINKIGTYTLAQIAKIHHKKFYSAAELYKYDLMTRWGVQEPIEKRGVNEVWGSGYYRNEKKITKTPARIPRKLRIENPAFDKTPAGLISAYITEEGMIPPAQLAIIAESKINDI